MSTFLAVPCGATVALHKMLQSECVSYYSVWRHVTSVPEDRTWALSFRRRAIRGAMDSIIYMLIFQSRPNCNIYALSWTQGESKDRHRFV